MCALVTLVYFACVFYLLFLLLLNLRCMVEDLMTLLFNKMPKDNGKNNLLCGKSSLEFPSTKFHTDTDAYEVQPLTTSRLTKKRKSDSLLPADEFAGVDSKICGQLDACGRAFDDVVSTPTTWESLVNDIRTSHQARRKKIENTANGKRSPFLP